MSYHKTFWRPFHLWGGFARSMFLPCSAVPQVVIAAVPGRRDDDLRPVHAGQR